MPDRPQHARTQSQGRKVLPPHARPTKAPPLRRGASYNHAHPQSHAQHHHSHSKSGAGWSKKVGGGEEEAQHIEEEEGGMASFLQFCATCEKQIVTPGASILYCSESCRRKDVSRPTSIQSIEAVRSPSSGISQATSYFDGHDILPQRSPTVLRPVSLTFSDLSLSDSNSLAEETIDTMEQGHNDASRYLEQFYADFSSSANYASGTRRPRMTRASTATDSSNIPSLVHSPSSSYGTVASNASYRPLPPRHNPFSTEHGSTKSIDLVLPCDTTTHSESTSPTTQLLKDSSLKSTASTLTSFRVAEANDITYDKRTTPQASRRGSAKSERKADRSLKQLFSHEAMKAPPRQ